MARAVTIDPLAQALAEQGDWRTAVDPFVEKVAAAFGIENLARGDNFERRDCFDLAAALLRSLRQADRDLLVEALATVSENRDRGMVLTPRAAFYHIIARYHELKGEAPNQTLLDQWVLANEKAS